VAGKKTRQVDEKKRGEHGRSGKSHVTRRKDREGGVKKEGRRREGVGQRMRMKVRRMKVWGKRRRMKVWEKYERSGESYVTRRKERRQDSEEKEEEEEDSSQVT